MNIPATLQSQKSPNCTINTSPPHTLAQHTMICRSCLRLSRLPLSTKPQFRTLTTSPASSEPIFTKPVLSSATPAPAANLSVAPAGTVLKGLNYLKGREEPLALEDSEYPEWLWTCLESKKGSEDVDAAGGVGDEFCRSSSRVQ